MISAVGLLVPLVTVVAQAATPLSLQVESPAGGTETLELTPPFDHTLEAPLGKETHRLRLHAEPGGELVAELTTVRKGKEEAARTVEKSPPTPGNAMSFMVTWPSHKSSSLGGAPATWKLRVTASEADQSGRSEALRADWVPTPHPTHTASHARVKPGARLFATADDVDPIAVWPADTPDLAVQVLDQQGGRLHVQRVTDRALCHWPKHAPHLQLEAWVELADLRRVLVDDAITVHPDGTATWLWAGAPVDRVGSDHKVVPQGQVVPSTAVVSDRFVPTVHPEAPRRDPQVSAATATVGGGPATALPGLLPVLGRADGTDLVELELPAHCGRVVAAVVPGTSEATAAKSSGVASGGGGERVGVSSADSGTLTWPDGRAAGQLVGSDGDRPAMAWFYGVKPTPDGRRCGGWSPDSTAPSPDATIALCWAVTAPEPPPVE